MDLLIFKFVLIIFKNIFIVLFFSSCIVIPYRFGRDQHPAKKSENLKYEYEYEDSYNLLKLYLPTELDISRLSQGLDFNEEISTFSIEFLFDHLYFEGKKRKRYIILKPVTKYKNPMVNNDFGIELEFFSSLYDYKAGCRYLIPFPNAKGELKMRIYFPPGLSKTEENQSKLFYEDSIVFDKKQTRTVYATVSSSDYRTIEWDESKAVNRDLVDSKPVTCD